VHAAIAHYVAAIPLDRILSTATHLSTDLSYEVIDDERMARALARRSEATESDRDCYASYIHEHFLSALAARGGRVVFQFSLGAEPLPFETASRLSHRTIRQLGEMISRHSDVQFQCFLASRHANQGLCTLARELPNFSLAGCWWHNVFPEIARQVLSERLDMLPANRQIAFFSDAYCAEWAYAKLRMLRRVLAEALAERIERGQYGVDDAIGIARAILFESPQSILGFEARAGFIG
jgi:hypothetical protein